MSTKWCVTVATAVASFVALACEPAAEPGDRSPAACPSAVEKDAGIAASPAVAVEISAPALSDASLDTGVTTRYEPVFVDPLLDRIEKREEERKAALERETAAIRETQKKEMEAKDVAAKVLASSLPEYQRPKSLEQFQVIPHLPPAPQHYTGTCWSFAGTSLLESEVIRITGKKVKLSEMHTVYWEYLAKAERYLAQRGDSVFSEGSQANAVTRMWKTHGAVPFADYPGTGEDGLHDHIRLAQELSGVLDHSKRTDLWDANTVLGMIRVLLDRDMGRPPGHFDFEASRYTSSTFVKEVLRVDPDDYVSFMSTLKVPFYEKDVLDVPDNWWRSQEYHNVPLDEFYGGIKGALERGYSVVVGGDVSEPGKDGQNDVLFIPSYDIPGSYIDQLAREYRIENNSTTDDHGVHLVGWTRVSGHDWFLVKDSGRSARRGKVDGYYFMRDDYLRLKMLTFFVHKDGVATLLSKFS